MKYLSKILFLFIYFSLTPSLVRANVCYEGRDTSDCQGTWIFTTDNIVDISYCNLPSVSTCAKGDVCPYSICGYTDNGCCADAKDWTAYETQCIEREEAPGEPAYITVYVKTTTVYSIGDKADANSSYIFDSSNCTGVAIAPYKACCDTSTGKLAQYIVSDYDGTPPLEAGCNTNYSTTISHPYGGELSYDEAYNDCAAYNPCQATCYDTPGGQTACSDFNNTSSNYSLASGMCSSPDYLCCSISPVTTPTPVCTTDDQCKDLTDCTTDTCENPGDIVSAKCKHTDDRGMCSAQAYYYCDTSNATNYVCKATDSTYPNTDDGESDCESNLSSFMSDTTTGSCYTSFSSCSSSCTPPDTDTPPVTDTASCAPWSCPAINGVCDESTIRGCSSGSPSFDFPIDSHTVGWTCYGSE